jgi:acyl-CoA thioester hydrolase
MAEGEQERRANYPRILEIPTRWMDNDVYGHVNNVVYYSYFDTVVNHYLIEAGGLDIHAGAIIGIVVESLCRFHRSIEFPDRIDAGLRVGRLGNTSVRYEIGLFRQGDEEPAATGHFVHVFVDREKRRPTPIPAVIRSALQRLAPDHPVG